MSNDKKIFWLRSESKENEFRRALTPNDCETIIANGHTVVVEDWKDSIIPTDDYKGVGCKVVKDGSWVMDAPYEAIIIGLKALPDNIESFKHTHIYFAHCYKEQDGWQELMMKFQKGGGRIIDLEFMTDENGRRTNAFGYWAGYVGAALGSLFSKSVNLENSISELSKIRQFPDKSKLIEFVQKMTSTTGEAIVIGCNGRSGTGAIDFLNAVKWQTTGWDQGDTKRGGPFPEILNFDLFVNCVLAMTKMPPFITKDLIETKNQRLRTISDVSCDPDSECNMIPLYEKATDLDSPLVTVSEGDFPVHLTAIDNLPSILPKESSFDFSSQLAPHIINFTEDSGPIKRTLDIYKKVSKLI